MSENAKEVVLEMRGITKVYENGFVANKDIHFSVRRGEIHALCGENGAGKSTLMKVLFGDEQPDAGQIIYQGKEIRITGPLHALEYGIGMVHQHFMLVPSLTVAENMVLGMEPKRRGVFRLREAIRMVQEVSEKYNLPIDPEAKVADLPVGFKQRVEILKILLRGVNILILDEPTAVLTPQETAELFTELVHLKEKGYTIIFISHKLNEVKAICDRLTVLRDGRVIGTADVADLTEQDISRMMVGRDVTLTIDKTPAVPKQPALTVQDVSCTDVNGKTVLDHVSFQVRRGEILGVAGVEGNGQRELSEIVTGLLQRYEGRVLLGGKEIRGMTIRQIREAHTAHVSEDRMTYGTVGNATVSENMISDRFYKKEYNRHLLLDRKRIASEVDALIADYGVKCDDRDALVKTLSGGNIQKVVAAREFSSEPTVLIANQPTRGIDVGASEFIRKKLVQLRDEGTAILLISADLLELLEVSDSIIVMCGGQIAAYFPEVHQLSEDMLGEYMLGLKKQSAEEIGGVVFEK